MQYRAWMIGMLLVVGCGNDATPPAQPAKTKAPKAVSRNTKPPANWNQFVVQKVPSAMVPINADLDGKVTLLGYTVDKKEAFPGDVVTVTWYWKCNEKLVRDWEYFTHLVDDKGATVTSRNSQGTMRSVYKPQMWKPGTIVADREAIPIPEDWKSPVLDIRTGLWSGPLRPPVRSGPADEQNRVRGPKIAVHVATRAPVNRPVPQATVPRATKAPAIDGTIGEGEWRGAAVLRGFVETVDGKAIPDKTTVYLLRDDAHLYVAAALQDTDIRSGFTQRDVPLWRDDAFDVFLDPGADETQYVEFQIAPTGAVFDARYATYREADVAFDARAQVAVSVDGSLNAADPADTAWYVEMAIPLATLVSDPAQVPTTWKANFYRVDLGGEGTDFSGWSAPLRGDFHALDRFGTLTM